MCKLSWPRSVGLKAFTEYAKTRGWTEDEIAKAWSWLTLRQSTINLEEAQEYQRKLAEEQARRGDECRCCKCKP